MGGKKKMVSRSVYLPQKVFDAVDEWAEMRGLSRNAAFCEAVQLGIYGEDHLLEQQRESLRDCQAAFRGKGDVEVTERPLPKGNDNVLKAYQESLNTEEEEEGE